MASGSEGEDASATTSINRSLGAKEDNVEEERVNDEYLEKSLREVMRQRSSREGAREASKEDNIKPKRQPKRRHRHCEDT